MGKDPGVSVSWHWHLAIRARTGSGILARRTTLAGAASAAWRFAPDDIHQEVSTDDLMTTLTDNGFEVNKATVAD